MKIFLYLILIAMEYALGKIVWLIISSMIINGLAVVPGIIITGFFLLVMVALWRYGSARIRE